MTWQPTANIATLQKRAKLLASIRQFFVERDVLEVETPLLCAGTIINPYINSFEVNGRYLQTSPEFAMKRLLAAGSGDIFQLCKAFRQEESGRLHNNEFTLLEWYRVGYDHHQLMQELADLCQLLLSCNPCEFLSYQTVFETFLQINPHTATSSELAALAKKHKLMITLDHRDDWLNLLLSHLIEPKLGQTAPCFIYDYPASQSALAKIDDTGAHPVAQRFELYYQGIELANGFHELNDAVEQRQRFETQLAIRKEQNKSLPTIDEYFLESLTRLPNCAGVAVGIDRLIMLACKQTSIRSVISFDDHNA